MRILVTGAEGFIGRHVVAAILAAGYEVLRGVRSRAGSSAPAERTTIECDFDVDVTAEAWLPRLAGVDAVVNCAGILRERRGSRFERVHVEAPCALFAACERLGIRRVIQVSALGDPADGEFVASKHRGDARLASMDLEWVVLRPSVVYSTRGSYGGTSLLRAMSATPAVLVLPGSGRQLLDPVAADDLGELVARLLAPDAPRRELLEVVGSETLTLEQYLRHWRNWLRIPPPRVTLHVPQMLVTLAAEVAERLGTGPLGRTMNAMLARGNVGQRDAGQRLAQCLGRAPKSLDAALAERPSFVQDRWQARLYLLAPVLRLCIAFVWLFSAWVGLRTSVHEVAILFSPVGVAPTVAVPLVQAASVFDGLLGILLLAGVRPRFTLGLMILSVLAYTAFIGTWMPGTWWDPFGGLLKNLVLLPALGVMLVLVERR